MDKYFEANASFSIFSKRYMELKKKLPIRPSQMGVLNIIAKTPGPHTPVILAEMLGVSKPMITAHLNVLSEQGYITREPSETDKRAYSVLLTEKALMLVADTEIDQKQQLDKLMDVLGQEEFEILVTLINQANQALKDMQGE